MKLEKRSTLTPTDEQVLNDFDLFGLSSQKRQHARDMLHRHLDIFSKNDLDVGNITDTSMKINLKDKTPVQQINNGVPKQLHAELKAYIEDLLNKEWIIQSESSYSSPVVAVRKKDGSLRLCVDYRRLNQKTIPDRHPLPRIQDILDQLGGNKYFSLLD